MIVEIDSWASRLAVRVLAATCALYTANARISAEGGGLQPGPAYLSDHSCENFTAVPYIGSALMRHMLNIVLEGVSNEKLQVRDRVRAHFTSYPGQISGTLANYSAMCSLLHNYSRATAVDLSTIVRALVHPLSSSCGVGEFINVDPLNNRWNEFIHIFSTWLLVATMQLMSVPLDEALPYIVHNLSLSREVSGLVHGNLMRLGGGFHGAAWEAVSRKLQSLGANPDRWSEIYAYCTRSAHTLTPWIETNCKHHAIGHGVMQYFMIRSLNATARSLYSPCFPLQRYSHQLNLSEIKDAEQLCRTSPTPIGCCDGMYHHYFKYAVLQPRGADSTAWAWPCAAIKEPEPCFQRAFVTHAVLYKWVSTVSGSALWPDGIFCHDNRWSLRVRSACVQALSMYTFISYDAAYRLERSRPMPYMLPSGIGVRLNKPSLTIGSLPSLCSMLATTKVHNQIDTRAWYACVVGAVQATSMYATGNGERELICNSLLAARLSPSSVVDRAALICMRAFARAGVRNNLGFVHYWTADDVMNLTRDSKDTSVVYYAR